MKNLILIVSILSLLAIQSLIAQEAPKGKKTLDVKEKFEGEYNQEVTHEGLSDVVVDALTKRVPKKLAKYGFNDITVVKVGKAIVPDGWAKKLSANVSKVDVALAELEYADGEVAIKRAIDRVYEENEDDWKFQVNFIDNNTKKVFKVRLSLMYSPKYIIKESDLKINLK